MWSMGHPARSKVVDVPSTTGRLRGSDHRPPSRQRARAAAAGTAVVSVGMTTPQHRADMFLEPGSDPRAGGPRLGDERATLNEFLRGQRLTLQRRVSDQGKRLEATTILEPFIALNRSGFRE
jgi:hypothetical protein